MHKEPLFNFWLSHFNSFSLITTLLLLVLKLLIIILTTSSILSTSIPNDANCTSKTLCTHSFFKVYWCVIRIHAVHNLPEPFCHLSFYLMPISHESSHYRFQSNLFPLWTAAVHIKEKKKSKNCTTILSLPNLLRTFNWKGEMATAERQYAYIKKQQQQQLENKIGKQLSTTSGT